MKHPKMEAAAKIAKAALLAAGYIKTDDTDKETLSTTEKHIADLIKMEPGIQGKQIAQKLYGSPSTKNTNKVKQFLRKNSSLWDAGYRNRGRKEPGYFPPQ